MTDSKGKVSVWAAALQDHYFHRDAGVPKSVAKQREKWDRENRRRQQLLNVRLPKINAPKKAASIPIMLEPDMVLDKVIIAWAVLHAWHLMQHEQQPHKVSLAQKMGILESPPKRLNPSEWSEIKERAKKSHAMYSNGVECAICCEPFAAQSQVVLSCGHSFHRNCIHAYERHTRSKRCPLCRTHNYETLVTSDAKLAYFRYAATKIQSVWRMWRCRRVYVQYRRDHVPKHPLLRKQFHLDKLHKLNQTLDLQMRRDKREMDALFKEMDLSIKMNQDAFDKFTEWYPEEDDWDDVLDQVYKRRPLNLSNSDPGGTEMRTLWRRAAPSA
ncbi:RING finger protein 32 [Chytriomyces hyalinus]|nr:RING finger protein 32 [Chytriomyces hyalinus]